MLLWKQLTRAFLIKLVLFVNRKVPQFFQPCASLFSWDTFLHIKSASVLFPSSVEAVRFINYSIYRNIYYILHSQNFSRSVHVQSQCQWDHSRHGSVILSLEWHFQPFKEVSELLSSASSAVLVFYSRFFSSFICQRREARTRTKYRRKSLMGSGLVLWKLKYINQVSPIFNKSFTV